MQYLQASDGFHSWHDLPQPEAAAGDVVSRDLRADAGPECDQLDRLGATTQRAPADSPCAVLLTAPVPQSDFPPADGKWLVKQKLMSTMAKRDAGKPQISGRGEVDDVYPGRARSGGKRGRSAAEKMPFVATVETSPDRRLKRFELQIAKGLRKAEITKLPHLSVAACSHVVSGGLSCWQVVTNAGSDRFPKTAGSGKKALQWPSFNWVSTTLGNIKTALAGNYQHVSTKHAQDDLASVASHFSRRYQLDTLTERLTWAELYAKPWSNKVAMAR